MTPEQIKLFFDANAIFIMFVWGLVHKYLPALAKLPNALIPWVNLAGYILVRLISGLVVPEAQAASQHTVDTAFTIGGVLLGAFTSAVWARQLYEGFGRSVIERLFGIKKAVARA